MIADYFSSATINGWDVVLAVVILVAGWIAAGFAKRAVVRLLKRVPSINSETAVLIARIVRYALLLFIVGVVLTVLGAPLQPVLAAVIIIVGVAALALRGIAANFGAGLVIQTRYVLHLGDEIEVLDVLGTVTELNGRSVVVHTQEGRSVRIPNSMVLDNPLVNLTERGLYRSELEIRIQGVHELAVVSETIVAALKDAGRVRHVPNVQVLLASHAPTRMTLRVRFWHEPHHRGEARSQAVSAAAFGLAAADIPASIDWVVPPPPFTPPPEF